jgi:hypothetical protein
MGSLSIWHWMLFVIFIAVALIIKFIIPLFRKPTTQDIDALVTKQISNSDAIGGVVSKRFSRNIPTGYQIYMSNVSLAGFNFYKSDAVNFIKGKDHSIELERDPTNKYDANAIKVIGVSSGRKYHIGFIPADIAKMLVTRGFDKNILARLTNLYLTNTDYLNIEYDLLIPRELIKISDAFDLEEPMSQDQKDFLEYFDQPIPSGMKVGQADAMIKEFTEKKNREKPGNIDDYYAYKRIIYDLNDEDELYNYNLKKPPKIVIEQALSQLKAGGISYVQILDDMDLLANEILKIRPELETND